MSLTISLATRGRPQLIVQTIRRTLSNIVREDTKLLICADEDDQDTIAAVHAMPEARYPGGDHHLIVYVKPREDSVGEKWNRALRPEFAASLYLPACDDAAIVTKGFDDMLLKAAAILPDNIGMVYTRMTNYSFPASGAVTAGLAKHMGFIFPEWFPYWFVDHWTDDVVKLIDRIVFCDVEVDQTIKPGTQEMRDLAFWAGFFDAGRLHRRRCARAIIDSEEFEEPWWRKEVLRTHFPLIEYKSKWINDQCRAMAPNLDRHQPPADARYLRIKARAKEVLRGWIEDMEKEDAS